MQLLSPPVRQSKCRRTIHDSSQIGFPLECRARELVRLLMCQLTKVVLHIHITHIIVAKRSSLGWFN